LGCLGRISFLVVTRPKLGCPHREGGLALVYIIGSSTRRQP
jgi:hypothetical protein